MPDHNPNTVLNAELQLDNKDASSLASHVRTNYIPTDDELTEIHSLLMVPTARVVELKAEIKRKEAETNALIEQLAQLELHIADYRALTSPMRRLPIDLLREIFIHCLPTNHNTILSRKLAPMFLTRVCSTWRAVALATPALWASLHVAVPKPLSSVGMFGSSTDPEWHQAEAEDVMRMRTRATQEWLARSGACRLDITLHEKECTTYDNPNPNYEAFLDIIIPHSERWRSMTFTSSAHSLARIASLNVEDVPALEELIINCNPDAQSTIWGTQTPTTTWTSASFLSALRLHRVSFTNLRENINELPIHFARLTHISLMEVSISVNTYLGNLAALLARCPSLISAKLMITHSVMDEVSAPSQPTYTSPIILPHLATLSLVDNGDNFSSLFAMLDTPQLSVLEYHSGARDHTDAFIAFLSRVSDTLTSLTTDMGRFSRSDLFTLLKGMHRLRSLSHQGKSLVNWWGTTESRVKHFDDAFLGMLVGRRVGQNAGISGQLSQTMEVGTELEEGEIQGPKEIIEDYSQILLPKLETLNCCPASFTDDGLLEFLKLRQSLPGSGDGTSNSTNSDVVAGRTSENIAQTSFTRLRRLYIHLDRKATKRAMYKDVQPFEDSGLLLRLSYSQASVDDSFSPADGIPASDMSSP